MVRAGGKGRELILEELTTGFVCVYVQSRESEVEREAEGTVGLSVLGTKRNWSRDLWRVWLWFTKLMSPFDPDTILYFIKDSMSHKSHLYLLYK